MSLLDWFKVVKWKCWLTGMDSIRLGHTSPDILPHWFTIPTLFPKIVWWERAAWKGPLRTAELLNLQIFFCKYPIMFLTQQVPWAVQRALRGYGWMSVWGSVLNCQHLEA